MGQSSATKAYNAQMAQNAKDQLALQQQMFEHTKKDTPEMERFRTGAANWQKFIEGKDYSKPPAGELLNFDLYNPARVSQLRERMGNLTGIGAAAMSGTGDQSIAIQQSRDRNANAMAQDAANSYENAIKQTDSYYKGQGMGWSQQDTGRNLSLLQSATGSAQFFLNEQRQTLPPSFWQVFSPIMGGALSAGSALLGNPGLFGK